MTAEEVVLEMLSILSTLYEVSSNNLELSCMTLCVEWGSTNTGWHINVHYVINFSAHTLSVKLNIVGIWEWGIYDLLGGGSVFLEHMQGIKKLSTTKYIMENHVLNKAHCWNSLQE